MIDWINKLRAITVSAEGVILGRGTGGFGCFVVGAELVSLEIGGGGVIGVDISAALSDRFDGIGLREFGDGASCNVFASKLTVEDRVREDVEHTLEVSSD